MEHPEVAHGYMQLASDEELAKDEHGFTDPNLHRRLADPATIGPHEALPRKYLVGVFDDKHSIRTTYKQMHDEDSETQEIP